MLKLTVGEALLSILEFSSRRCCRYLNFRSRVFEFGGMIESTTGRFVLEIRTFLQRGRITLDWEGFTTPRLACGREELVTPSIISSIIDLLKRKREERCRPAWTVLLLLVPVFWPQFRAASGGLGVALYGAESKGHQKQCKILNQKKSEASSVTSVMDRRIQNYDD